MDEKNELTDVNNNLQENAESSDTHEKNEEISELSSQEHTEVDYAEIVKNDIRELSEEFSELAALSDICQLENPIRYAALRDLGLTPAEAYLATTKARRSFDNRSHLYSSPIVSSARSSYIPEQEMEIARGIFSDMSDAQIRQLYKKVTK